MTVAENTERMKSKWKLVTKYPVTHYKCGLIAGDRVRIKESIIVKDHVGKPTGKVYPVGEIWTVLKGAAEENPVLWLRQADGERCTWSDDDSVFETFEKLPINVLKCDGHRPELQLNES